MLISLRYFTLAMYPGVQCNVILNIEYIWWHTCLQHTEGGTKWPLFCRRHIRIHFLNDSCCISIQISLECVPKDPIKYAIIDLDRDYPNQWRSSLLIMMTSSNGNIFCVTGPLWGKSARWLPVDSPHKGQWRGALMLSLICAWTNAWANTRFETRSRPLWRQYNDAFMHYSASVRQ